MYLVDKLIQEGWLKSSRIIEAFRAIKRVDFLPLDIKDLSQMNEALPIGYGQTISQPLVVAFMMELLQPQEGDKILDVGSGSGWTSALLGKIVGKEGKVFAIEIVKELKDFGENNVSKYNFISSGIVKFICADGSKGYKKESPFNKILSSASSEIGLPLPWKEQVKIGGRIVSPIGNSIHLFIKKSKSEFEEYKYPGFSFVPLIEKEDR